MSGPVEHARAALEHAERIVVLTGAGVSAESGVPTFRGTGGLWKSHRPEELATPAAFTRDPRTVWEWYAWRRGIVATCAPNAGHLALARLALEREHVTLVTQNVDGLPHRAAEAVAGAGEAATRAYPLEVHGAIHRDRCSGCDARTPGRAVVDTTSAESLPRCEACGALLRPDVVWFGEPLDLDVLGAALAAAEAADVCLVVGTSSVVYPAAGVAEIALRAGAALIEVNPEETPLSPFASVAVRAGAAVALPAMLAATPCGAPADGRALGEPPAPPRGLR